MSGGNPRVDEDMYFIVPSIPVHTDPATGESFGVSELPSQMRAEVADPSSPTGKRLEVRPMRNQVIVPASQAEQRRFLASHCCLNCRNFDHKKGQEEMKAQRVFERIVREHNWEAGWFGVPPEAYGLCGQSGDTLVSPLGTCANWRDSKGSFNHFVTSGKKLGENFAEWLFRPER